MTIMDGSGSKEQSQVDKKQGPAQASEAAAAESPKADQEKAENMFSNDELPRDTKIDTDIPESKGLDLGQNTRSVTITPEDKVSFIDSVVNNTRFTRNYSLFGGKISLTVRSMTTDEVNALAAWTIKQGTLDPNGLSSGRYRKFLAAAQVSRMNGVDMPPLDEPLFETLGKDGVTITPPGWIERCKYWDNMGVGLFGAVMGCLSDFDLRYSMLCRKAEDANFWNPDTP